MAAKINQPGTRLHLRRKRIAVGPVKAVTLTPSVVVTAGLEMTLTARTTEINRQEKERPTYQYATADSTNPQNATTRDVVFPMTVDPAAGTMPPRIAPSGTRREPIERRRTEERQRHTAIGSVRGRHPHLLLQDPRSRTPFSPPPSTLPSPTYHPCRPAHAALL